MIQVTKGTTGAVSFLHISEATAAHRPKPTVIFFHGFKSAKENNLHYAYLLAEKGIRVILPDCIHHGDRDSGLSSIQLTQSFWEVVIQSIHELEILKEYLVDQGLSQEKEIGVAGTSMGAIITFGALKKYPWIKAAVSLMGCPSYQVFGKWKIDQVLEMGFTLPFDEGQIKQYLDKLAAYDLSLEPEKMNGRPLLCWHGSQDQEVPVEPVIGFVKTLRGYYKNNPQNIGLIIDEQADHKVSRKGVLATVDWFATHMGSNIESQLQKK
ncbi:fermentation-respiration switch protein FrsA (DUF1100 family) [Bacillus tianshenii]|uniref:Fermentation-respiration switch protein FrsA (DUF1100 family) n=1 Tax=Sutcliffiella tianshenii TaxID=1463404 RepID=A0ABS2P128_9BACI|nr:prolyl oligopeptidase family serine peptidase [Bacillus tianshenii]MBM7620656.1 fermentation-respiration switch protein FrsA (DUF1100 family) [Bacillus tianshenii]